MKALVDGYKILGQGYINYVAVDNQQIVEITDDHEFATKRKDEIYWDGSNIQLRPPECINGLDFDLQMGNMTIDQFKGSLRDIAINTFKAVQEQKEALKKDKDTKESLGAWIKDIDDADYTAKMAKYNDAITTFQSNIARIIAITNIQELLDYYRNEFYQTIGLYDRGAKRK